MVVKVKWFYHPEETKPGRKPSDGKVGTFESVVICMPQKKANVMFPSNRSKAFVRQKTW